MFFLSLPWASSSLLPIHEQKRSTRVIALWTHQNSLFYSGDTFFFFCVAHIYGRTVLLTIFLDWTSDETGVDAKTNSSVPRRGNLTKQPNMTTKIHRTVRAHARPERSARLHRAPCLPVFTSHPIVYGTLTHPTCLVLEHWCSQFSLPSSFFLSVFHHRGLCRC